MHYTGITCITLNYTNLVVFQHPLQAFVIHWQRCFMQQTCSIHMRTFDLALPHGWWADLCPMLTQRLPSTQGKEETLYVFATWSSWHSARIVCLKAGTRPMLIRCQWSLQTARPDWLTLWLPCPWLISRRQISCWVTPFTCLHCSWLPLPDPWSYIPCRNCPVCPEEGSGCCWGKVFAAA